MCLVLWIIDTMSFLKNLLSILLYWPNTVIWLKMSSQIIKKSFLSQFEHSKSEETEIETGESNIKFGLAPKKAK